MRRRSLCIVVAAVHIGGCASWFAPQTRALLDANARAADGASAAVELDNVPFFPQTPFHCGPAALATAMAHAGVDVHPDELARAVFVPAREGSLQAEMLAAPRSHDALATRVPGSLHALRRELLAGYPVVVLQNLGLSWQPRWHFAVLVGIDLDHAHAVLRSGTTRREVLALETFELTWARAGAWAFVVTRAGQWPAGATQGDAEQAAVGFERAASPVAAMRAYESLLERWPASFIAAMGLGNVLLALKQPADAVRAFEHAARAHDRAAAWNNLAVARARAGQRQAASVAAQRALELARRAEPALLDAVQDTAARLGRGEVP